MTDDEARAILAENYDWVCWDEERNRPDWNGGYANLDGNFTVKELLAILHFAPKQTEAAPIEPMTEDERIAIAGDHELDQIGIETWHMEREPGESTDSYRKRIQARKKEFKEWLKAKYAPQDAGD